MVIFGMTEREDKPRYGLLYKQDCFKKRADLQDNESRIIARFLPKSISIPIKEDPNINTKNEIKQPNLEITKEISEKIVEYKLIKPSNSDVGYNFLIGMRHIERISAFLSGFKLQMAFLYFDKSNSGPHIVNESDYRRLPLFDENISSQNINKLPERLNELLSLAEKDYLIKRALDFSGEAVLQWFEDPEAILLNGWKSIEILAKRAYFNKNRRVLPLNKVSEEISSLLKKENITFDELNITNYYELRKYVAHGLPTDYTTVKDFEAKDLEKLKEISNADLGVIKLSRTILRAILRKELDFN